MKKKFIDFSMVLLITLVMSSCSSESNDRVIDPPTPGVDGPITEKSDNAIVTYQYEDGVIVLSENSQRYLSKIIADSILYFLPETPDVILPKEGSIISSRITDKTPYGLGNIVLSKTEEDGLIKCVTTVAPLDKIFKVLDVESEFSIVDLLTEKDGFYDDEGNYYPFTIKDADDVFPEGTSNFARMQTRFSVGSDKVFEIPIKIESESGLFSEVKLVIGGIITFDKSKSMGSFEYSFEPSIGIVGEFGAKTEKKLDNQIMKLLTLIKKSRIFSGHLPIMNIIDLRPFIDLEVNLVGSINGKVSVGFSYFAKYKCGWNESGPIKEKYSTERSLNSIFNSFELKGKAEIGPEAIISTGCGLYTTDIALALNTKPSIMVGAELGASGNSEGVGVKIEDQKVTLDVAVDLEGSGRVSLFGKELFAKEVNIARWNLYNGEWPLFPLLVDKSFNVEHRKKTSSRSNSRGESSEVFDANYSLTGGLMTKIMNGKPAIRVEKDGKEIYRIVSQQDAFIAEQTDLAYELSNLEKNVKYRAYPCIIIGDAVYDWNGLDFSYSEGWCPDEKHPHMIDLGLPSGTKWACCNVGANSPNDKGDFFAWGEVHGKTQFSLDNYEYAIPVLSSESGGVWDIDDQRVGFSSTSTTGISDIPATIYVFTKVGDDICGSKYDAAKYLWNKTWRMPNVEEMRELTEKCKIEYYYENEAYWGELVKGPNGNCIFLPYTRIRQEGERYYTNYRCWTGTLDIDNSYHIIYHPSPYALQPLASISAQPGWRNGSIRPVSK